MKKKKRNFVYLLFVITPLRTSSILFFDQRDQNTSSIKFMIKALARPLHNLRSVWELFQSSWSPTEYVARNYTQLPVTLHTFHPRYVASDRSYLPDWIYPLFLPYPGMETASNLPKSFRLSYQKQDVFVSPVWQMRQTHIHPFNDPTNPNIYHRFFWRQRLSQPSGPSIRPFA